MTLRRVPVEPLMVEQRYDAVVQVLSRASVTEAARRFPAAERRLASGLASGSVTG